jgi:hypothetical protein
MLTDISSQFLSCRAEPGIQTPKTATLALIPARRPGRQWSIWGLFCGWTSYFVSVHGRLKLASVRVEHYFVLASWDGF